MINFDVVGFGALNVDKLFRVQRFAGAEEESLIEDFTEACGGSAANTTVGLARLGCKTGFIGKVADDYEGKLQLECFKTEGVDTDGVIVSKKGKSGACLGFVDRKGARALYINPGVNATIESRELKRDYLAQTKILHLSSFIGEKSFRTQKKLLCSVPKEVKITFDPGSVYAQKGFAAIEPIIENSYAFLPNALELERLTGEADFRKAADLILSVGVKIVAVKLGSKGCYVTDGEERLTVAPFKVNVVDTTGAGDAFNAGFLYGLIGGKSLFECAQLGNFVAARSVTKMGAQEGLPYKKDLALM